MPSLASSPVILSASRATDIPAFYAEWFFNRLRAGCCVWINPFNRKPMRVGFGNVRAVVFWTKNPRPILPYLHELDERGIHYYFQFTLNDYEAERFEPGVPPLEERAETFRELASMIGKERVIWRFDPMIITPTPSSTPRGILTKVWRVGNLIKGCTDKLVFSFVDVKGYRKVQGNMVKETPYFNAENVESAELTDAQRIEVVEGLVKCRAAWAAQGWNLTMATCAEGIDLEAYGIEHNRCIDGDLMERLWPEDKALVYYLRTGRAWAGDAPNAGAGGLFGGQDAAGESLDGIKSLPRKNLKDKGQRAVCGCIMSKDIGVYNTCRHFCAYCYANASREGVMRASAAHDPRGECLA